jgi:hypothetical protein
MNRAARALAAKLALAGQSVPNAAGSNLTPPYPPRTRTPASSNARPPSIERFDMRSRFARKLGPLTCTGAIALLVTACGGGAAKVAAAGSQPASQAGGISQGATPDAASAAPVKATGGGAFCKAIAASMNAQSLHPGLASGDDAKAQIEAARSQEHQALSIAPSALKPDLQVLVAASDAMFNALAKANYDYSKLTAADMVDFSSAKVTAAEAHLTTYLKDTCGIDLGAGASAAAAGAAASAGAAVTDNGDAAAGSSDPGSACNLATVAEVSAGAGKPMKLTGGEGPICAFGAVDDPGFFIYVQVYSDAEGLAHMTQAEGEDSDHLDGLADDAFWNKTLGAVYVRKGSRAFSFTLPSLANITDNPDAIKSKMVTLATAAAGRF